MPKALRGQLRIGAMQIFGSPHWTADQFMPWISFQDAYRWPTAIIFCKKVVGVVFHLHVSDAFASTVKMGGLIGHLLVKGDDVLHHGAEVAFHNEFP